MEWLKESAWCSHIGHEYVILQSLLVWIEWVKLWWANILIQLTMNYLPCAVSVGIDAVGEESQHLKGKALSYSSPWISYLVQPVLASMKRVKVWRVSILIQFTIDDLPCAVSIVIDTVGEESQSLKGQHSHIVHHGWPNLCVQHWCRWS